MINLFDLKKSGVSHWHRGLGSEPSQGAGQAGPVAVGGIPAPGCCGGSITGLVAGHGHAVMYWTLSSCRLRKTSSKPGSGHFDQQRAVTGSHTTDLSSSLNR